MTKGQKAVIAKLRAHGHLDLAQEVEDVLLELEREENLTDLGALLLRHRKLETAKS